MARPKKAPLPPASSTMEATRRVFLSALGCVLLIAFASLAVQVDGLVGPRGILPAGAYLAAVDEALQARGLLRPVPDDLGGRLLAGVANAWTRVTWAPTLGWWLPDGWAAPLLCWAGMGASLLVIARRFAAPALLVAWACALSLGVIGQDFLGFQWDTLLTEVAFAATLVAPWGRAPRHAAPVAGWWLLRWILFRLVFFGGLVKLTSGDPSWWSGAALTFHYESQPLPNPVSWYAHHLPVWVHVPSTFGALVVELALIWGVFLGRRGREVAFLGVVALMGALALTGNFGFFQLLTVVLALSLLDDGHWAAVLRGWRPLPLPPVPRAGGVAAGAVAGLLVAVSLVTAVPRYTPVELPAPLARVRSAVAPWRTVNHYGLFAVMTTARPLPVLEARWGDGPWTELTWRWQTSDPAARPAQVAPHMPRLDWQLWFAGLRSCERTPWVQALMVRLLEGSEPVARLVGDLRLVTSRPPDAVRLARYEYRFAPEGAAWWVRERTGLYCPEVTARAARIGAADDPSSRVGTDSGTRSR